MKRLIILAVLALFAMPVAAQQLPDTITVTGNGSAAGAPDIANLEIGVENFSEDVTEAFAQTNETIQNVIDALVALGVASEDIRTVGLNIYQERFPGGGGPASSGMGDMSFNYNVRNQVRVTVRDTALVADVINAAVEAGANNIYGLNFSISNSDALESDARAEALQNAENRAAELAGLVGAELGDVVIIEENPGGGFGPFPMQERGLGGGGAAIEPGQLSVNVSLRVTYRISR